MDDSILKRCSKCKEHKPATTEYFASDPTKSTGLSSQCKVCKNIKQREKYTRKTPLDIVPEGRKRCTTCHEIKPATLEYFTSVRDRKSGLAPQCKECHNRIDREKRRALRPPADVIPDGYKRCAGCKEVKPATKEFFHQDKDNRDGLHARCRVCQSEYRKHLHHNRPLTPLADFKRCSRCRQSKPATREFFTSNKSQVGGLGNWCKRCLSDAYHAQRQAFLDTLPVDNIPNGFKRCIICKEIKPATLEHFYRDKTVTCELNGRCIICHNLAGRRYYIENKEAVDRRNKLYVESHKERIAEYSTRWYRENRDRVLHTSRHYHATHREQYRLYGREYRQRPYVKMSRKISSSARRARMKATPGTLTSQQIHHKLKAQRYRCYYAACGHTKFERRKGEYVYHIEHTIPVSRTEHNPRHDMSYTVLACPACNLSKHNKLPHEWPQGGRLL